MRALAEFVKTTLIGGLLIVLPSYLTMLLLIKTVAGLIALLAPLTAQIPASVEHRQIAAIAALDVVCLIAGILVRTKPGSMARSAIEERVLMRIPGYEILRNIIRRLAGHTDETTFTPALVEVEDNALAPAFIIEELPDGRFTVMVPSVPTPAAGALFVLEASRVHPIDVPLATMFRTFSHFGAGTGALVEAMERAEASRRVPEPDPSRLA
jgi:uncharacterized membrane protein